MKTTKQLNVQLDKLIEAAYYRNAQGVQINIMDINKVFTAGRAAHAAGTDVEQAVVDAIAQLTVPA